MTRTRPTVHGGRTRGTGAAAPSASRLPKHLTRTRLAAAGLAAATATGGLIGFATSASAGTPPTGPGNIEAWAARDMVLIEGYTAQAGQTVTVKVSRNGQVMGTATAVVDATGAAGWNDEGCWTDVTPDIQAGDIVSASFSGSPLVDGMIVGAAEITQVTASTPAAGNVNSVTISGTYDPDDPNFSLDRFSVEVVNPAMRDAGNIGERAILWEPTAPVAGPGYTVDGTAAGGEFSVTFGSLSAVDQQMVFDGEKVAMSWMANATTIDAQLGMTANGFGEVGGGAAGCPAGPANVDPPTGEYSVVWSADDTQATVTWTPAVPVAGATPVEGYSVVAVEQAASAAGAQRQVGYRTGADATQVVLDGLTAGTLYDIDVRSIAGGEMGAAFKVAGTESPTPPDGTTDTTDPVLTTTPALNGSTAVVADDRQITLSADEGTIYYTVDGSAVTTQADGNVPSPTAQIYTAPIPVTAQTTINIAVIDAAGNAYHESGVVTPKPAAAAVAPTGVSILGVTGSGPDTANPQGTVNVGWTAVPDATEYLIRVYDRTDATATTAATNVATPQYDTVVTGATNGTVDGLPKSAPGHRWVVRVQAKTPAGANYGPMSTGMNAVVPGDTIGVVSARWRAGNELEIRGSGTNPGATITAHRPNAVGGPGASLGYPAATVGALEAPDNTGPWAIVVTPGPATNPGDIVIRSSEGHFVKVTVETR